MNTIQKIGAALAAVVLLTGIVAGCGSQNSGPQSSPSQNGESNQPERQANESTKSDSENSGQEQQTGGTVRVAIATEPDNLDPYLSAATDTYSMMDNVYDGLLEVNPDGSLRPAIAESYDISEDGLTYTFRLRQNVVFHDGSPLTSEDVRASYARLAGLNGAEALSSKFSSVESIETPDDHTVVIHLSENDAAFLAANTEEILPSDYENHSEKPIGAGPYQFVEYVPGQELVLEKFESFYDKAHFPSIDRVEFKFITDSNAAVLALQAGDIDLYPGISEQGVMQLGDGFHYVRGPQNMVQLMALNHEVEPLGRCQSPPGCQLCHRYKADHRNRCGRPWHPAGFQYESGDENVLSRRASGCL